MDTLAEPDTTPAPTRLDRRVAALIGVLAVAAALAAGHLVAGVVGPNASPFLAVGNSAIDLTPSWLKDFAVRTFGSHDKQVLLGGMALTLLLVAIAAGLLSRASPRPGQAVAAVFGVLGIAAVANRPDLDTVAVLAPLASLVAGVLVFAWLHRAAAHRLSTSDGSDAGAGRREFLRTSSGVVAGVAITGGLGQFLAGRVDVEGSRASVGPLRPATPAPAIPASADFSALGTPGFLTENSQFYRVDTAIVVPRVRAETWTLRLHGMVGRELSFSYADIRNRPLVERTITMTCVSNEVGGPYISTANFTGVPLRDLVMAANPDPKADQLYSTSVDGWTTGTPLEAILDPERGALLAIGMNGEPLPVEHGFPARLVVPGLYGYVSATKWVTDLEVTTFGSKEFYWQERGWADKAPIKTQSRIDVPGGFAKVPAGEVVIAGIAWAQHVGIDRVEVRVDGGPWQDAELATEVNKQTWRQWKTAFTLQAGSHRAEVRATDRDGHTQTDVRVPPIPDGATGWHSALFTVE
ncbi:molybdopterin-dependent oxidoreductase [Actinokineospora auranticolor]|uniref:DMSO/TMAO reductase YedYZ molybdopterin-dependent catalytic subunit n=1 Tax=Actinokineospora auranticolor TaxID=155976 RepID=A0A2S6GW78_9PSEU|nr:molybdopterin-dependent oxidoreductase [Actinokineospora auranticolor]PPK69411.1 DMSO/TMAO reductase YedYZ molybdopterin-dependent catalytic subunit [Actinokineospora auranticolor]